MATRKMPWYEFAPGTFEIDEFDCASVFLITGSERSLLLDTGVGVGDLRGLVESLTDLSVEVAMTHGHGDHIGGAGWFDSICMNERDWGVFPCPPELSFRREYAGMIRAREHKHYGYDPAADIRPWPGLPQILPLEDGQVFDLGGRTVTAYACPGHTPGEMVFIDSETRVLFAGDACNNNLLLSTTPGTKQFTSVEMAAAALRRIWEMRGRYDSVMNSHHDYRGLGAPLDPEVLPNALRCCEGIIGGTAKLIEIPDLIHPERPPRPAATVDGSSWVCFDPQGVRD